MTQGQLHLFGPPEPPPKARRAAGKTAVPIDLAPVPGDLAATARKLPPELRLGTSSWSFPGWAGIVWGEGAAVSEARLAREGLAVYARHPLLRAVGLDRTYYAPLAADEYARYASQVPEDFGFLVKALRDCTWPDAPSGAAPGSAPSANPRFLDAAFATDAVVGPILEGLGAKAGPLLFQFPPLDLAALGGATRFAARLRKFLGMLPAGPLYAVEIRNRDLLGTAYREALASAGAVHCFNVHTTMPDVEAQEEAMGIASGTGTSSGSPRPPALVVRWMLGGGRGYEAARDRYAPFDRLVDEDLRARDSIAGLCFHALRAGRSAFVIANNKAEGSAPLTVFKLAEKIARFL